MDSTANLSHEDLTPEQLRAVFDILPIACSWSAIADQAILYQNPAFHRLFGYAPDHFDTVGEWIEAAYPFAEDRVRGWERWGSWLAAPPQTVLTVEPSEVRILCQNGIIKTILQSFVILPRLGRVVATFIDLAQHQPKDAPPASPESKAQEAEAVYRMLAANRNSDDVEIPKFSSWEALISDRHRQREALRLSEELLDRTGRIAGVGGWDVDLLTGIVTWTAATHRLHAVPPDFQPTLETGINFYAPEARAMITNVVEHAIATGEGWDVEAPLIRADGKRIWIRTRGSVEFAQGKPIRLIGAFQDITTRVSERNALKLANERLVLATASGSIGIWDRDIVHNCMIWDERMYGLYGLEPDSEEPSYTMWMSYVHPDDRERIDEIVRNAVESQERYESEFRIVWPDGTIHHICATGHVTRDDQGNAIRLVGANWDVTEQRRLAAEAARALKVDLQMKDDFLSHVSHELRSPLASIYSFAGILADGIAGDLTQTQAEYLEIILRNSRQLRSMIDDLLQVTRSETGKLLITLEPTAVKEAISDTLNTLRSVAEAKWIAVTSICDPQLPLAFADPTRLRQILIVILDNAVKFTPPGGFIEVRAKPSEANSGLIQVSITDSGPGINPEAARHIFEHLYQVDAPGREGRNGLGLGLYIARDLVQRQGGTIWVESKLRKGTVFHFTMPVLTTQSASQPVNPWGVERRRKPELAANQST